MLASQIPSFLYHVNMEFLFQAKAYGGPPGLLVDLNYREGNRAVAVPTVLPLRYSYYYQYG